MLRGGGAKHPAKILAPPADHDCDVSATGSGLGTASIVISKTITNTFRCLVQRLTRGPGTAPAL